MIARADNLRGGLLRRSARGLTFVVTLLVGLGGGLGVPVYDLREVEVRHERAVRGTARLAELRREMREFEAAGGFDRLERARLEATGQIPGVLTPTTVHGAMQVLARTCGFDLDTLNIGELKVADLESAHDGIGLCEVSISGSGSPMALQRLIDQWRGLGYPTRLLQCRLDRGTAERMEFDITATLGLYQSAPWLTEDDAESDEDEEIPGGEEEYP